MMLRVEWLDKLSFWKRIAFPISTPPLLLAPVVRQNKLLPNRV